MEAGVSRVLQTEPRRDVLVLPRRDTLVLFRRESDGTCFTALTTPLLIPPSTPSCSSSCSDLWLSLMRLPPLELFLPPPPRRLLLSIRRDCLSRAVRDGAVAPSPNASFAGALKGLRKRRILNAPGAGMPKDGGRGLGGWGVGLLAADTCRGVSGVWANPRAGDAAGRVDIVGIGGCVACGTECDIAGGVGGDDESHGAVVLGEPGVPSDKGCGKPHCEPADRNPCVIPVELTRRVFGGACIPRGDLRSGLCDRSVARRGKGCCPCARLSRAVRAGEQRPVGVWTVKLFRPVQGMATLTAVSVRDPPSWARQRQRVRGGILWRGGDPLA
eukprot:6204647-Pleurochrysis_carterae.AAC.1